jgi:hypothetical protein
VEVTRDLKLTREQLNLSSARRKTLPTIERIQKFFDRTAGIPVIARELREDSKRVGADPNLSHRANPILSQGW